VISLSLIIKTFEYLQELLASDKLFIKILEYLQELLASDKIFIKNICAQNNCAYPHLLATPPGFQLNNQAFGYTAKLLTKLSGIWLNCQASGYTARLLTKLSGF